MRKLYSAADEKHDHKNCPIPEKDLRKTRGIEVGHIFYFGTKYSKSMNVNIATSDGKQAIPEMGSYGIGVSRLVGAIIESSHDENGIIWPESVAPFKVSVINLKVTDENCSRVAEDIYRKLQDNNVEVLYDDTNENVGAKFATNDLIGIPYHITVGPKGAANGKVEFKIRKSGEKTELSPEDALSKFI